MSDEPRDSGEDLEDDRDSGEDLEANRNSDKSEKTRDRGEKPEKERDRGVKSTRTRGAKSSGRREAATPATPAAEDEKSGSARTIAMVMGAAVAALVLFLAFKGGGGGAKAVDAGVDAAPLDTADAALTAAADPLGTADAGDPLSLENIGAAPSEREDRLDSGVGAKMPDGTPVPALPEKAPRTVRFGVVFVTYSGAQGAPPNARPKAEAKELAEKLAAEAKTNFSEAVAHGDPGSGNDLGRIPRGSLELAPEYVLFTLPAGQTSEPIDTPRGFWIVKRID